MGAGPATMERKPCVVFSLAGCDQIIVAHSVWGYLTGGEEEQQQVDSGSSGLPSR